MENLEKCLAGLQSAKKQLENTILCQEMGNDMYYSSPLYSTHQRALCEINQEIIKLSGEDQ